MDRGRRSELTRRVAPFASAIDDSAVPLDELALLLSAALQPGLDLIGALAALDQLAADCPTPTREGIVHHLFGSGRFVGDHDDSHRWQNSCLDHVIATGRGMPITLAIVGVEVARRLGVELAGVGMPGLFLIGDRNDPDWFADPFHGHLALDRGACRALLRRGGMTRWSDQFLDATPDRLVIARVLNNLKLTCEERRDAVRLAIVMQARQALPEFADERTSAEQALAVFN